MPSRIRIGTLGAAAMLALSLGAVNVGTSTAHTRYTTSPVGVWEGTVQHAEGSGAVRLSFHKGGLVCLSSSGGEEGGGGEGRGTWRSTAGNRFTYQVEERLYEADGSTAGWVQVNQDATQYGTYFTSSGISDVYAADRTFLGSVEAKVSVRKVAGTSVC